MTELDDFHKVIVKCKNGTEDCFMDCCGYWTGDFFVVIIDTDYGSKETWISGDDIEKLTLWRNNE